MATNFSMTDDTSNNRWQLSYRVDQAGTKSTTLKTGGKFTDRDIKVDIITPPGSYQHPVSVSSGTITPTLSLDSNATTTYGLTTTKPSGTAGTQFLTFNPEATVNSEASFTSQIIINEGYLEAVNTSSDATSSTTVNGGTNYYMPVIKPAFSGGGLSNASDTNSVTTVPVVTITEDGSFFEKTGYGVTTTKPSGTDGTNYLTVSETHSGTNGTATSVWTANRAATTWTSTGGALAKTSSAQTVLAAGSQTGGATATITPTITDNFEPYYIPIVNTTISGGGLTENTNTNIVSTVPVVTVSGSGSFLDSTNYGVTTTQPSGDDNIDYLTVDASGTVTTTGVAKSSWKATRAAVTQTNAAGAIAASNSATKIASGNISNTKTVNITPTVTDNFAARYIPIVKPAATGGALSGSTTTEITVNGMNTSDDATSYFIDAAATGSVTRAAVTVPNSAGAIAANSITGIAQGSRDMGSSASRVYIPAAAVSVTATKAATAPTATKITSGTGNVIGSNTIATSAPTSGYFVGFTAGAPATTLTPTKTLTTAGYISSNTQITASASTTASSKNFYIPITTGVASAGTGDASISINTTDGSNAGYNISASLNPFYDTEPTSGPYIAINYSGSGFSKVTTAGWFPAGNLTTASTSKTTYLSLKPATVTPKYANTGLSTYFNTGSSSSHSVSITPQFTANQKGFLNSVSGNGTVGYWSIKTTSVSQGTSSITNGTLTRGAVSWGTGWVTTGAIPAATFANAATGNTTYLDISNTSDAPILISEDYLYINKGYTDNLKISLAKLVPDWNTTTYTKIAAANHMRNGYVAYDQDGAVITGTIQDLAGGNKYAITSDQTISCSGKYMTSDIVIKKLTQTNYTTENIKAGVTITVNNSNEDVYSVEGEFTSASTVSTGQIAAAAAQIRSGYSAWVDGVEVKGTIANGSGITFNNTTGVATAGAGYYATNATGTMQAATVVSGTATISTATYAYNSTNDNFTVSGKATISAPTVSTAGHISSSRGTKSAKTDGAVLAATVSKIAGTISLSDSSSFTPTISRQAFTISGVTDAASNVATTDAPTSGVYVKVKSASATAKTISSSINISTAGYGTNANHGITNGSTTVGLSASADTYVPIKTADPAFKGGAISGSVTGISSTTSGIVTLSDTSNGIGITAAASAGRAAVTYDGAVAGWVAKTNGATAFAGTSSNTTLTGKTRYITAINVPKDTPFTLTSVADTALDTTSKITITNAAYRNMIITNSANGTISTLTNNGTITSLTNNKTLAVVSSNTSSSVTVNALPSTGSTATGAKTIVSAGRWETEEVTPSASAQGPFYGAVTVKAISEGPAASGFSLSVTAASGSSDVSVGTLASGKYPITANNLSVTGTLNASTGGYFTSGSATDSDVDSIVVGKMNAAAITLSGNGALNGKAASAAFTGITTAATDEYKNGLLVQSKGTAGRTAVTYTNTAGYIPAHTNAQTLSSSVAATTWNGTAYYLKGVTLTAPSTGERQFDITVPNGTSETITFHFHVDKDSNVYVD